MKIRVGFVSNSSSSSYVAILPADRFDEYMKSLNPFEEAVVNFRKIKVGEVELMIYTDFVSSEDVDDGGRYSKKAVEIANKRGIKLDYDPEKDEEGWVGDELVCNAFNTACDKVKKFGGWFDLI